MARCRLGGRPAPYNPGPWRLSQNSSSGAIADQDFSLTLARAQRAPGWERGFLIRPGWTTNLNPLKHRWVNYRRIELLRSTFQMIEGIGPERESELWRDGVTTWDELAEALPQHAGILEQAAERLDGGHARYFQDALGSRECWRLYADFQRDTAFLDIETTGLSPENSYVTMVGILDYDGFTAFVRGDNLDELPEALRRYSLFVSYNGAAFDMPFLEKEFGRLSAGDSLFAHAAHLDLRYPLRRLGFKGGLKKIEQATGLGRPGELSGLSGYDAVRLWKMANDGEPDALTTLIRYNAEDVASLPRLTELMVDEMAHGTPLASLMPPAFPGYDTDALPFDPGLVRHLTRGARYATSGYARKR